MHKLLSASMLAAVALAPLWAAVPAVSQQTYPGASQFDRPTRARVRVDDAYRPPNDQPGLGVLRGDGTSMPPEPYGTTGAPPPYTTPAYTPPSYSPPPTYSEPPAYGQAPAPFGGPAPRYQPPYGGNAPAYSQEPYRPVPSQGGYARNDSFGQPYAPPRDYEAAPPSYREATPASAPRHGNSFSADEIKEAGHNFFGSISQGLASVIEHAFRKQGRPNGYILGEEAGGAFVAGLRYGRGRLHTRDAGVHNVYWQGPSLGFDAGAAGSRVMILVYNLRDVGETFDRFGGIDGSAYVVGGVGLTFLTKDHVVMAPIRSGVGLRLGANVGYLKFTQDPTWNPF